MKARTPALTGFLNPLPCRWVACLVIGCFLLSGCTAGSSASRSASTTRGSVTFSLASIAAQVNLTSSELPSEWMSDNSAGPCVTPHGPSASCSSYALPGAEKTTRKVAACLGIPVSHVALLFETYEPGAPESYTSSTYTGPTFNETANSAVALEPSTATTRADLDTLSRAAPSCVADTVSSFNSLIENLVGAHATVTDVAARVSPPTTPGAEVAAFRVEIVVSGARLTGALYVSYQALIGAGRVEAEVVVGELGRPAQQTSLLPLFDSLVKHTAQRAATAAGTA